jgi:CDP-diglyceride synthetase
MQDIPFQIIGLLALVGIVGAGAITRKRDWQATRGLWLKLVWYIGIVSALSFWFLRQNDQAWVIAVMIVATGLVELVCVYRTDAVRRLPMLLTPVAVYLVIAAAFLWFALTAGAERVTWVYVQVAVFDGFSQIVGQLAGRRKLAPSISPNKTVEGLVGGLIMTVVAGVFLHRWFGISVLSAIGLSLLTAGCALTGDLLAACFKREHGVKDYSSLIPAHGGMLDRFNGFVAAGAAWAVVGFLQAPHVWTGEAVLRLVDWPEFAGAVFFVIVFLAILWIAERLRQLVANDTEISRKVIHVATGFLVMGIPGLLHSHWTVLVLCASLGFLLEITRQAHLLPAVHTVARTTAGCVCYPCAIYLCYRISVWDHNFLFYYLPLLILAIADTMAALIGRRARRGRYRVFGADKSVAGVVAFFVSAACVAVGVLWFAANPSMTIGHLLQLALLVAATGATVEGLSGGGWDNLTVPVAVVATMALLQA